MFNACRVIMVIESKFSNLDALVTVYHGEQMAA